jgi:vacuolar protein sorting-associated protein 26
MLRFRTGEKMYIYTDGEDICGSASVILKPGKRIEHLGIKVEIIGRVEIPTDRPSMYDFFTIAKDLEPAGVLVESKDFKWKFTSVDKSCETYWGNTAKVRYFVRLSVQRPYGANITREQDFCVQNLYPPPETTSLKMEVGIEDCLHIEFEYDKSKYHTRDVIIGKVYFLLVRIKVKYMEIDIIRRETTGSNPSNQSIDNDTIAKFEIMDGAPVRGECIPVRIYLSGFELTPTHKTVQNRLSVKYFLNLVLVDEEDRRYFKQQEIVLWRKKIA